MAQGPMKKQTAESMPPKADVPIGPKVPGMKDKPMKGVNKTL